MNITQVIGLSPIKSYKLSTVKWSLFFIAFTTLAVLTPYTAHQFGIAGQVFLPMHFFVFLAAMAMGIRGGVLTALASPALSFVISGMPPAHMLMPMTIELSIYALISAWLLHHKRVRIITALVVSMIIGKLAMVGIFNTLLSYQASNSTLVNNLFIIALPGIIIQLLVLPLAVSKISCFLKDG